MALVKLMQNGLLSYVVTTNVDGLHGKSGIPQQKLAELHGNIYMEYCNSCGKYYYRDFNVQELQKNIATIASHFTRFTGRLCDDDKCKGKLRDSIISFGENLPEVELNKSHQEAAKADLNIVIGSSMRVEPACSLPFSNTNGKRFVCLINLQKTPYDNRCTLRVWAKCDEFFKLVMQEMNMEVDQYKAADSDK
mmetsp:Transcript_33053/g.52945  ORF Transcript_33053/g.52945 Transcript_33053/m.52945 type:complete len:193 (+) Transcript_33053:1266-1844(+)